MLRRWIEGIFGGDLAFWANVAAIVGLVGIAIGVVALIVAERQLKLAARATYGQLILMIDDAFYTFEDVRAEINTAIAEKREIRVEQSRWFRYMGIFERIGVILESKLIKPTLVDELYGERFAKLLSCKRPKDLELRPEIAPQNWSGFLILWKAMEGHRSVRKSPGR